MLLLVGFVVMDGFDPGRHAAARGRQTDDEAAVLLLNSVGPVGGQPGVAHRRCRHPCFAAWPLVYALPPSLGALRAFMFLLFGLFLRPVGFDYRSKLPDPVWRRWWDRALVVGGRPADPGVWCHPWPGAAKGCCF